MVWVQSYEMKTPMVSINGEYAAIGDQQGNSIYICNKSGPVGKATTLLPILRVTVSAKGIDVYKRQKQELGNDTQALQVVQSIRLMVEAAWNKKESRGTHMRLDYPEMVEEYEKEFVV